MVVRRRIELQSAYLLHSYPWRETSLIVEMFSLDHGRVSLLAKGARRPLSVMRGALMAFQPLSLSWSGSGEVKTLHQAEWLGGQPLLQGASLLCGYYLNELLLRLLPREDAHAALFNRYAQSLAKLAAGLPREPLLREFEFCLLRELGYAPALGVDGQTGETLVADALYTVLPEHGPVVTAASGPGDLPSIPGHVLLNLAAGDLSHPQALHHAKHLMRRLINHHLEGRELASRRILMETQEL